MTTPSPPWSLARTDELRARILFTLGALLVWRMLAAVTLPGLSVDALSTLARGGSAGLMDRVGVAALGLTPFMAAWAMTELARGSIADATLDKVRRWLTMLLAVGQGVGLAIALEGVDKAVVEPGWQFRSGAVATLTAGTMFLVWLGEQITRRGLGDGIWLLIAAQVIHGLPGWLAAAMQVVGAGAVSAATLMAVVGAVMALVVLVVFVEQAERRLPVSPESAGYGAERLVLRIDNVTILPLTMATMLLLLPALLAAVANSAFGRVPWLSDLGLALTSSRPVQIAAIAVLMMPLTVVLTAIVCRPRDIVARLRRDGASIAGETPAESERHIDGVIGRLTAIAAPYLLAVYLVPELVQLWTGISLPLAGVQLLVVVLVALRVINQARAILTE